MKNLYEQATVSEVKARVAALRPDSPRQWGKMTVAQAMAHCAAAMESAVGDAKPPRVFIGRLLGGMFKKGMVSTDAPMQRNSPTADFLRITDERDFAAEQQRLITLVDRFANGGPAKCTTWPHAFFGPMTSEEWAVLMYKHSDHHLRQFGG